MMGAGGANLPAPEGVVMENVTVGPELATDLARTDGIVEVRDPDGMVVGYFAPLRVEHAIHYADAAAASMAHCVKVMNDPRPKVTTAELLTHLNTLG